MAITYERADNKTVKVFLGDSKKPRRIGTIQKDDDGFRYYPKQSPSSGGDAFPTLLKCKRSLEG